jgi:paired amphipathic helix protein Sin3a
MDIAALFLGRTRPRKSCQHDSNTKMGYRASFQPAPSLQPLWLPPPSSPRTTHDEPIFSDRAKRNLESKETYEEFLKLLNMYLQDTIDAEVFVNMPQAQVCLSDGDLFWQFRD